MDDSFSSLTALTTVAASVHRSVYFVYLSKNEFKKLVNDTKSTFKSPVRLLGWHRSHAYWRSSWPYTQQPAAQQRPSFQASGFANSSEVGAQDLVPSLAGSNSFTTQTSPQRSQFITEKKNLKIVILPGFYSAPLWSASNRINRPANGCIWSYTKPTKPNTRLQANSFASPTKPGMGLEDLWQTYLEDPNWQILLKKSLDIAPDITASCSVSSCL